MRFKTTENNQSVETTRHGPVVNVMTDTLATAQNYCLRNMPHNRQLPDRISPITDCNFGNRTLRTRDRSVLGHFGTRTLRTVCLISPLSVFYFAQKTYHPVCFSSFARYFPIFRQLAVQRLSSNLHISVKYVAEIFSINIIAKL